MSQTDQIKSLNSIAVKFALAVLLAISGMVIILVLYFGANFKHFARETLFNEVNAKTELIAQLIPPQLNLNNRSEIDVILTKYVEGAKGTNKSVAVLDLDGNIVTQIGEIPSEALLEMGRSAIANDRSNFDQAETRGAVPLSLEAFGAVRPLGVLVTSWTTDKSDTYVNDLDRRALIIATVVGIVAVLASLFAFRGIVLRPLGSSTNSIARLGNGELDVEIGNTKRRDEFGRLGRTLSVLRENLLSGAEAERDARFKSEAFANSSAALVLADHTGKIFAINPAFEDLAKQHIKHFQNRFDNFNPTDLIGKPLEFFHPGDGAIKNRIANLANSTISTTISMEDVRISLKINSIVDDAGDQLGYVLEWQDVTEVWKNTALIGAINAIQMRAEFTPEGQLTDANDIFNKSLGLSASAVNAPKLQNLIMTDSNSILREVAENGAFIGRITLKDSNGSELICEGSITSVTGTDGKPYRLFLLGRDITESRKAAETAAQERLELDQERATVVTALQVGLKKLSEGDLRAVLPEPFADRYEELRQDYNLAVDRLAEALGGIAERAGTIRNEAQDISGTAETLARRTESTAATLEQTAAALDALTGSLRTAAESSQKADTMVAEAKSNAERSGQVVLKTVSAMDQIASSSEKVTSIIKVIDDIAFQTNLLALNAGVEAARAGDAGRGFAVVASEVRALAQRSSDAAREINDLIAQSGAQVKIGVELVGETGAALEKIVSSVSEISDQVSEIAGSTKQQALTLEEINASVTQLDQSTQQNAARLEETTAASDALRSESVMLVETIAHFQMYDKRESPLPNSRSLKRADEMEVYDDIQISSTPTEINGTEMEKVAAGSWTDF